MPDDQTLNGVLTELDAIANAPMTPAQREVRAAPVLASAGVVLEDLTGALARPDLGWTARKAEDYGVSIDTWLLAMRIALRTPCHSLGDLLDRIHQSEAAVHMLKAGYTENIDNLGNLTWQRG
jgi:hypothetical protein